VDWRLPMVLLVHGGPWRRTSWGSNAAVTQWLANRGWVCAPWAQCLLALLCLCTVALMLVAVALMQGADCILD
jgi:hypothetical protein